MFSGPSSPPSLSHMRLCERFVLLSQSRVALRNGDTGQNRATINGGTTHSCAGIYLSDNFRLLSLQLKLFLLPLYYDHFYLLYCEHVSGCPLTGCRSTNIHPPQASSSREFPSLQPCLDFIFWTIPCIVVVSCCAPPTLPCELTIVPCL